MYTFIFISSFFKNDNLDDEFIDAKQASQAAKDLKKINSLTSDDFLELLKTESRAQLQKIFTEYESVNIVVFISPLFILHFTVL